MNKTLKRTLFLVFLFSIGSCQSPRDLGPKMELKLPLWIAQHPEWWSQFQARARYLEIAIFCEEGLSWKQQFEPSDWNNIAVPKVPCPNQAKALKIEVSFWDCTPSGELRVFPALRGTLVLKEEEIVEEPLVIPLHFQAPPEEL